MLARGSGVQWPCNEEHPNGAERLYVDGHFATDAEFCENFGHDLTTGRHLVPVAGHVESLHCVPFAYF